MKKWIFSLLPTFLFFGCAQQKVDTKAEAAKLMETSREWSRLTASKDIEKILSYWADDATLISSGQPLLKGKKDIRQMVESSMKTPGFQISWEPDHAEISETGDMGYLIEKTRISFNDSTGKTVTMKSNAVTIWKKNADGTWKNVVDISSAEQ
ncbi:MAG: YybH family protein [Chitinophagales bacterium]